jgi:hypothetical protein
LVTSPPYQHWIHQSCNTAKKTVDIVTPIEFLLDYDTAGDPITGLKWSRRTTAKVALALADFGISVSQYQRGHGIGVSLDVYTVRGQEAGRSSGAA